MKMLIGAALALSLALPAAGAAQAPQPSPFKALEVAEELQLTADQRASITVARDSLREAHRIHCAPMHASTPSEADEAKHHAEMAVINARWEGAARGAMTPVQLQRLADLRPAQPAAGDHGGDHHQAAPAAAGHGGHHGAQASPATAGHGGHHGAQAAPATAGHGGHHGAHPAPAAKPAEGHTGHHPSR
jgi:cellobiose-specific phosphotransferase system component IIA